jgi:ribosomal protein L16 Arg81 hydroxylase
LIGPQMTMPCAIALPDKMAVHQEPFGREFAAFLSSLAERNQSLATLHVELADRIERLLGQEELIVPGAKLLRTTLRSFARRNRREAWQHLTVALNADFRRAKFTLNKLPTW